MGKTIKSVRDLGRRLGISHVAVLKWLKRDDWSFGEAPWAEATLPSIRRWAANELQRPGEDGGSSGRKETTLNDAKKLATLATAQKRKIEIDLLLKKYHAVEECRQRRSRAIQATKLELLGLPDSLPVEVEVKDMIRRRISDIMTKFAAGYLPADVSK